MTSLDRERSLRRARDVARTVVDPELPMLTLADLGVLRDVDVDDEGTAVVTLTPTYVGCPAMNVMRADVVQRLREAGFAAVEVRTQLAPPWSTDDISEHGRALLREHGIAPPGPRPADDGPVLVQLGPPPRAVPCPNCGAAETELVSTFGATACKALRRCPTCAEPFEHVKPH